MTSPEQLVALLEAFENSDWQEMTAEIAGARLSVSRREGSRVEVAAPSAAAESGPPEPVAVAPAAALPATPVDATAPVGTAVRSPSVGIFWRRPSPTEPPFVEVGARVHAEDTVGIVEVMKLMQQVPAGVSGIVTAIPVGNAETVEYGQPLVFIDSTG